MSRREFSIKVKRAAYERCDGRCEGIVGGERCPVMFTGFLRHYDHVVPDGLGGEPTLENCAVLCLPCHDAKTRKRDVPTIAKMKRIRDKHRGIRPARKKIQSAGFHKAAPQKSASRPIQRKTCT